MVVPRTPLATLAALVLALGCSPVGGESPLGDSVLSAELVDELVLTRLLSGELLAESGVQIKVPNSPVRPLEIRRIVQNGTAVEAGDLLFEFDNAQLAQNLEQRRVSVTQAQTALVTAQAQGGTDLAQASYDVFQSQGELEKARIDAAVPEGIKSDQEYDRLQLELHLAELHLSDAEAARVAKRSTVEADIGIRELELTTAVTDLQRAESGIEILAVKAPSAGVVVLEVNRREDRLWQEGDIANTGDLLARIPDLSTIALRARLFDVDDGLVEPGLRATATFDAFPESSFSGRVRQVDRIATQHRRGSTARFFDVIVDLDSIEVERIVPGMSVRVKIEQRVLPRPGEEGLMVAPRQSLDFADGGPRVLLADGSWLDVQVGACSEQSCVIEDGDLRPGVRLGRVSEWVERQW